MDLNSGWNLNFCYHKSLLKLVTKTLKKKKDSAREVYLRKHQSDRFLKLGFFFILVLGYYFPIFLIPISYTLYLFRKHFIKSEDADFHLKVMVSVSKLLIGRSLFFYKFAM